ncbi:glycoside hydrolase family 93 protein [Schizophyllum amplum]|uniref:Glycoside hydrolase family 93 protein n=1 Tax=Schizophyllum amplum TaxID=97359 RepID=A0A550CES9_9AGAR|nr:glycoside hydrolase family 93 protein [Auriculariopsis ampla]
MARFSFLHATLFLCAALTARALVLAERAPPLVPHVDATSIDISPNAAGAYPRLARLADGTLIGSYTTSASGSKTLTLSRSTNGGQSFTALSTIATSPGDLDNAFLLQLGDGTVLAAFRNHDLDSNGNPTYYRLTVCSSSDNGASWTYLSQIAERAATSTKNGLWEPWMRLSADGAVQVYYASENAGNDQDILMQMSTDGGASWGKPVTVAGGTTTGRDGMPGCANFYGGLMCVFETTEGTNGRFVVKSVISTDDGVNWGQRSPVYAPADTSRNAGAPQIAATTDGTLVTSFMTDEDASVTGWPNVGAAFKIVTSAGEGGWAHKTEVSPAQSSWPGLLGQEDGSVLGCAGHDGEGAVCHKITFTS